MGIEEKFREEAGHIGEALIGRLNRLALTYDPDNCRMIEQDLEEVKLIYSEDCYSYYSHIFGSILNTYSASEIELMSEDKLPGYESYMLEKYGPNDDNDYNLPCTN